MKLGEKVRILREFNGYSQEYLSIMLDVSQPMISRIENNRYDLKLRMLEKIAAFFVINISELLNGEIPDILKSTLKISEKPHEVSSSNRRM